MKALENRVSVCVPIYGVEKYVERCAISVLGQTYENIEYIFVNDCTPDMSMEILRKVVERYPQRQNQIHIINHQRNRGLSAARNTALQNASGSYICWVDSDDYIAPNMVEKMMINAMETHADIVTCDVIAHYPYGDISMISPAYVSPHGMTIILLKKLVRVSVWGRLIKRDLYLQNGIKPIEGINNAEDFQVMPRLAFYAQNVSSISDRLYYYNCCNSASYTYSISEKQFDEMWKSTEINYEFFKDKGQEYMDALEVAKVGIVSEAMLRCCNVKNRYLFNRLKDYLYRIDPNSFQSMPLKLYVVIKVRNYCLLRLMSLCFKKIKDLGGKKR